jgi:hypothetical protein
MGKDTNKNQEYNKEKTKQGNLVLANLTNGFCGDATAHRQAPSNGFLFHHVAIRIAA